MDIKKLQHGLVGFLKKYRYVALILLLGIILMMLPSEKKSNSVPTTMKLEQEKQTSIGDELVDILQNIDGVGKAKVMLTIAAGEETIYQINEDVSESEDGSNKQIDTVIVTDAQRNQLGLIRQTNPPEYLGAIVLCQGADNASVKLSVVDAVSKITGLKSDCISVLKMK